MDLHQDCFWNNGRVALPTLGSKYSLFSFRIWDAFRNLEFLAGEQNESVQFVLPVDLLTKERDRKLDLNLHKGRKRKGIGSKCYSWKQTLHSILKLVHILFRHWRSCQYKVRKTERKKPPNCASHTAPYRVCDSNVTNSGRTNQTQEHARTYFLVLPWIIVDRCSVPPKKSREKQSGSRKIGAKFGMMARKEKKGSKEKKQDFADHCEFQTAAAVFQDFFFQCQTPWFWILKVNQMQKFVLRVSFAHLSASRSRLSK